MAERGRESVANLARLFDGAAAVLAIRLPFVPGAEVGAAPLAEMQALIEKVSGELVSSNVIIVPGADGFLVVSDQAPGAEQEFSADGYRDSLKSQFVDANFEGVIDFDRMSVQSVAAAPAKKGMTELDHATFIAKESVDRHRLLNEMCSAIPESAIDFLPIAEGPRFAPAGTFLSYSQLPRSGHVAFAHRDKYSEPAPICAAIDMALLRAAVERKIDEMEEGNLRPIIVPLHFGNVSDNRYWSIYESEFRNIPDFLRRFIGTSLVRIQPGVPPGRVADAVTRLRSHAQSLYLSVPLELRSVDEFAYMGLDAVVAVLPPSVQAERRKRVPWASFVDLVKRLKKHRLPVLVQNATFDQITKLQNEAAPDRIIPLVEEADLIRNMGNLDNLVAVDA